MEDCRPAALDDVDTLVRLAHLMRAELAEMRGGHLMFAHEARAEPLDVAFRELLGRADAHVVIGTIDDAPVGFGAVEVEPLLDGDRLGVITELFVEEEARAVGVGEVMAKALLEFCTTMDCVGVDARALPGHRAAKNFFEEQGFTARALVMHRPLRGSQ